MGSSTLQLATQLTSWPIDWVIFVLLAAVFTLESFKSGSSRTRALSLSLPIALVIQSWLPNTYGIEHLSPYLNSTVALNGQFLVITVTLFVLLYRLFFGYGFANGSVLNALMTGFATTIIVFVIWLQIPTLESVWLLSDQVQTLFGEAYRLWWLILAFILMAIAAS